MTGQNTHKQPDSSTSWSDFPLAQNKAFFNGEFLYVGQLGHEHSLKFSVLFSTFIPIGAPANGCLQISF